ncbi:Kinesin light chain 3 [Hondaea fermentalgiana]|uniref:Kinesin light chain 3 n=1 Tax=Hondaea fermentalgiana TaxID=2315210 RepID=A0A2R5GF34_9STRA|nr:Kinesin light chain 3 [Hondaea fermentalgiana]|eukprot:GBG26444.1 Kinesin light chain 3 [Hondaea fermentalgiana]
MGNNIAVEAPLVPTVQRTVASCTPEIELVDLDEHDVRKLSSYTAGTEHELSTTGSGSSLKSKDDHSNNLVRYSSIQLGTLAGLWQEVTQGLRAAQVELFVTRTPIGKSTIPAGTTVGLVEVIGKKYMDVCNFIVLPLTQDDQSFFSDWLLPEAVGAASTGTYVSAAHDTTMDGVVDALLHHFADQGIPSSRAYVWIDVFCINQSQLLGRKSGGTLVASRNNAFLSNLAPAMKKFDNTALVVDSWDAPQALTRAWCVWELYVGALGGRELHVLFTPESRMSTAKWLETDSGISLLRAVESMGIPSLDCASGADLTDLLETMNQVRGGFSTIKRAIQSRFKRWLMRDIEATVRRTREACIDTKEDESFAYMLANAGRFLRQIGEYHNALNYFRICRQVYKRTRGTEDVNYGAACNSMASVLRHLGKYDEALELFREDLAVVEANNGPRHHEVARVLNNIANCYAEQGDFVEALRLSGEALDILQETEGESSLETAETLQNMAIMYMRQDEHVLALEYYEKVLDILREVHGKNSTQVADVLVKVAGVHLKAGDSDKALDTLAKVLSMRRKVLGKRHHDVAKTLILIAKVYEERREIVSAVELAQQAVEVYEEALGAHDAASQKARRYMKELSSRASKAATKANMRSYMRQNI